ncbi:anti-sigma factor [Streptomyces sp. TRM64462]|uniref:anti-sigma factor family protein n=1 Tax=Streptomyces sp. TRM64462 TaxID=2741726 RepID=UPI001586F109|nr:anti-sigma factor [Streptomyces sp. TRM64462]
MTSTADTTQHPEISEISDLTEGILPPSRTADVRRHLDTCPLCADVRTSLEEIRGLLGTLPGPVRMPADIAERIDAALAAEALLDATAPQDAADVSRETVAPAPRPPAVGVTSEPRSPAPADTPGGRPPGRSSAADAPGGRPPGRSSAATGPGRRPSVRRRRRTILSAVCGLAAVGLGVVLFQGLSPTGDEPTAQKADTAISESQAVRFSGHDVADKVRALLAADQGTKSPRMQPGVERESVDPGHTLRSTEVQVPPCVQQGIGRTEQPLAGELGDFRGRPAYLVVLPRPGADTQVDVYIVDTSCATSPAGNSPADVLLKQTYPRT